jgi:hypothetical protein
MNEVDKELLGLEVDVFWASVAGVDPADLLKRYSGTRPAHPYQGQSSRNGSKLR